MIGSEERKREIDRQLLHIAVGLVSIILLLFIGRTKVIAVFFTTLLIGTYLVHLRMRRKRIGLVDWFEKKFERKDVRFPGYGSVWYTVGVLFAATFLHPPLYIAATIFILSIGDGCSTIIGQYGRIALPYNKKKTLEGSLAFLIFSLMSYFMIGWMAIPLAVVATIVESLSLKLDDNITIPVTCVAFFLLVG